MKSIRFDFPKELEKVEIIPIADCHIGDGMCNMEKLLADIEYIYENDNAYCVLNGDLMDSAICTSVGDTYGADIPPMEQLKKCVEIFGCIRDKILCIVGGNHEHRIYKTDGIDMTDLFASQLGIVDKYSRTTALLFISIGQKDSHNHNRPYIYSMYCTHGAGGGKREGGKINRLADLAGIVDADVYIHAHTHLPAVFKESFYRMNIQARDTYLVEKTFVNTAAYLNYGGYGDVQGYKPGSLSSPVITLYGNRQLVKVSM